MCPNIGRIQTITNIEKYIEGELIENKIFLTKNSQKIKEVFEDLDKYKKSLEDRKEREKSMLLATKEDYKRAF